MMQNSRVSSWRILLSTLLVVTMFWLAGAVTPQVAAQAPSAGELQSLLSDLGMQFQLAYRHNVPEREHRYEQVRQVVSTWNEAARTAENREILEQWLHAAIRASMPGMSKSLPSMPMFNTLPMPRESIVVQKPVVETPIRNSEPAITVTPIEDQAVVTDQDNSDSAVEDMLLQNEIEAPGDNFWSGHPGAEDLPESLWSDPFKDDPLPGE